MRYRVKFAVMFILMLVLTIHTTARSESGKPLCTDSLLDHLRHYAPEEFKVYELMTDKGQFTSWFQCQDPALDLATAVHESVHVLTEENDVFPLINGEVLARPSEASSFLPPKLIARKARSLFGKDNVFVQTYLGSTVAAVSSADDFLYLLDELNAFGHDLNTATKLSGYMFQRQGSQIGYRDGLAALMAFVSIYVNNARESNTSTWQGLQGKNVKPVLRTLWLQGELVLSRSCETMRLSSHDQDYIRLICNERQRAAMAQILDGQPFCPETCLVRRHGDRP